MRNDTIFFRPVSSAKTYREFLSGTVTVNHADGETLKLRSRSGRGEWYRLGRGKRDFVMEVRVASFRERLVVSVMEM